jgi:hypothetical protein
MDRSASACERAADAPERSDSRLRLAEQVRDLVQVVLNERRQSGGITGQWAAMFGISYAT